MAKLERAISGADVIASTSWRNSVVTKYSRCPDCPLKGNLCKGMSVATGFAALKEGITSEEIDKLKAKAPCLQ